MDECCSLTCAVLPRLSSLDHEQKRRYEVATLIMRVEEKERSGEYEAVEEKKRRRKEGGYYL